MPRWFRHTSSVVELSDMVATSFAGAFARSSADRSGIPV
jgi:hypothetical protein